MMPDCNDILCTYVVADRFKSVPEDHSRHFLGEPSFSVYDPAVHNNRLYTTRWLRRAKESTALAYRVLVEQNHVRISTFLDSPSVFDAHAARDQSGRLPDSFLYR